ncbi:mRNA export factor Gle1 [Anopheles bellator]|uniref:mRNA export factor Gle1 n=1 Tax=Anopheles bellator TaxID=139047 RepID=UPI0026498829|nr:mRNA export factor Gle1 [Anopheles bellator]
MGSKNEFNVDDLLSEFETMKISALRNAAKVSPMIKERTIGPDWDVSVKRSDLPPDCETVTSKLHHQELERQRHASVRKSLDERQTRIRQADQQREEELIRNLREAAEKAARKQQEADQRLLKAILEQEQAAQEATSRRQAEIEEENRRLSDIATQLKHRQDELRRKHQLIETIRQHSGQFRVGTDTFTKALTAIGVQHATKFVNQKKAFRTLQRDFDLLLQTINASQEVDQKEADLAADYCRQLDQVNVEVTEIVAQIESAQKQQQEQQEQLQQQRSQELAAEQANQQQAINLSAPQQPQAADSTDGGATVVTATPLRADLPENEPFFQPVSPECLHFYTEVKSFYEKHQAVVKQLLDDASMKTYRFNCQKAINIPVNAISAVNREHFIDKYNKLAALLSGQNVKVADVNVSVNGHPLGRTYCTMLLAKKFVSQADTGISSNASAAFPIAAIAVALWQRFPEFGLFFLAYLHRECPYLVPYYLPQFEGQTQEEFLKTLGYRFTDGTLEKQDQYLKRMSGLARLYAAVIVTVPRRDDANLPHPHGLECGWRWLTNILNRFPQPDICATVICEFLQTAGADLHAAYGRQFLKVLRLLQGDYLTALNRIDTGGPKARLEGLVTQILSEGRINRPEGMLSPNFW